MVTPDIAEALMARALAKAKEKGKCVICGIDGKDYHVWPETDVPAFLEWWIEDNYGSSTVTN